MEPAYGDGHGSLASAHPSLWTETTAPGIAEPLRGERRVDVAVIGAGITGLTAAALLSAAGVRLAVLEAGPVAAGTSGYTTGKLTALHGLIYADLVRRIGTERARIYASANLAALAQIASLIDDHDLACDFERQSAYTYTSSPGRVAELEAEANAGSRVGLDIRFTTETALPFPIEAAVRLDDQAQFHPRKYCLGLVDAITRAGGSVFAYSRVTRLDEKQGACSVHTAHGSVHADRVIVATLIPFIAQGEFDRNTTASRSYLIAVPMSEARLDGMYLSADTPVRSLRHAGSPAGRRRGSCRWTRSGDDPALPGTREICRDAFRRIANRLSMVVSGLPAARPRAVHRQARSRRIGSRPDRYRFSKMGSHFGNRCGYAA